MTAGQSLAGLAWSTFGRHSPQLQAQRDGIGASGERKASILEHALYGREQKSGAYRITVRPAFTFLG